MFETKALDELIPEWKEKNAPIKTKVSSEEFLFLNKKNGFNIEIQSTHLNSKLQKGDILLKIGNTEIFERGDIIESTFYARPGTFVEFLIKREGKELTIPIRVTLRPASNTKSNPDNTLLDQNLTGDLDSSKLSRELQEVD